MTVYILISIYSLILSAQIKCALECWFFFVTLFALDNELALTLAADAV